MFRCFDGNREERAPSVPLIVQHAALPFAKKFLRDDSIIHYYCTDRDEHHYFCSLGPLLILDKNRCHGRESSIPSYCLRAGGKVNSTNNNVITPRSFFSCLRYAPVIALSLFYRRHSIDARKVSVHRLCRGGSCD